MEQTILDLLTEKGDNGCRYFEFCNAFNCNVITGDKKERRTIDRVLRKLIDENRVIYAANTGFYYLAR